MANFKKGQLVKITGDSFTADQHGFVGAIGEVSELVPATPFQELPPLVQLIYAMNDYTETLPARVHVHILDENGEVDEEAFANVVYEDLELVEGEVDFATGLGEGTQVELLEDDWCDCFFKGDIVTLHDGHGDGDLVFTDRDGDHRRIESFEYRVVE